MGLQPNAAVLLWITTLDEDQDEDRVRSYDWLRRRRPMRFYFDLRDKLAIPDEIGRDLKSVSEAIVHARYLAADLRCLESDVRPRLSIQVVGEGNKRVHEEVVFA
jgi:hypothetical protein